MSGWFWGGLKNPTVAFFESFCWMLWDLASLFSIQRSCRARLSSQACHLHWRLGEAGVLVAWSVLHWKGFWARPAQTCCWERLLWEKLCPAHWNCFTWSEALAWTKCWQDWTLPGFHSFKEMRLLRNCLPTCKVLGMFFLTHIWIYNYFHM